MIYRTIVSTLGIALFIVACGQNPNVTPKANPQQAEKEQQGKQQDNNEGDKKKENTPQQQPKEEQNPKTTEQGLKAPLTAQQLVGKSFVIAQLKLEGLKKEEALYSKIETGIKEMIEKEKNNTASTQKLNALQKSLLEGNWTDATLLYEILEMNSGFTFKEGNKGTIDYAKEKVPTPMTYKIDSEGKRLEITLVSLKSTKAPQESLKPQTYNISNVTGDGFDISTVETKQPSTDSGLHIDFRLKLK